jgi:hypothetical protein
MEVVRPIDITRFSKSLHTRIHLHSGIEQTSKGDLVIRERSSSIEAIGRSKTDYIADAVLIAALVLDLSMSWNRVDTPLAFNPTDNVTVVGGSRSWLCAT